MGFWIEACETAASSIVDCCCCGAVVNCESAILVVGCSPSKTIGTMVSTIKTRAVVAINDPNEPIQRDIERVPGPSPPSSQSVAIERSAHSEAMPEDNAVCNTVEQKNYLIRSCRSLPSLPVGEHEYASLFYNQMIGLRGILKCNARRTQSISHVPGQRTDQYDDNSVSETSSALKRRVGRQKCPTVGSWKDSTMDDPNDPSTSKSSGETGKSIAFRCVHIREYARTVGDNPSCSSGAPIS